MKKARVDAIIKAKVREAEATAYAKGHAEARRAAQREYEMLCKPVEGSVVLGEQPKHREFLVPLHPMYAPRFAYDPGRMDESFIRETMRDHMAARFVPLMKRQDFGNGQSVVWYEYQFRGFTS